MFHLTPPALSWIKSTTAEGKAIFKARNCKSLIHSTESAPSASQTGKPLGQALSNYHFSVQQKMSDISLSFFVLQYLQIYCFQCLYWKKNQKNLESSTLTVSILSLLSILSSYVAASTSAFRVKSVFRKQNPWCPPLLCFSSQHTDLSAHKLSFPWDWTGRRGPWSFLIQFSILYVHLSLCSGTSR